MPDSAATTSRRSDVRRPWVLVDAESRVDHWRNATTARGFSSNGTAIEVSFELADPPAVSIFFVHCPDQTSSAIEGDPRIVSAAGAFVLLLVYFAPTARRARFHDYFVYRAGPGKPSLDLIPAPYPRNFDHNTVGVLPLRDGQHYAVVVPVSDSYVRPRTEYRFHVFRSDRRRPAPWSMKPVRLTGNAQRSIWQRYLSYGLDGVVYAGAGLLGWLNLSHGVLLCNVLDEDPVMRVIEWPVPATVGTDEYGFVCEGSGRMTRHATIADGVTKFTELEFHQHCRACRRSCSGAVSSGNMGPLGEGWTATTWTKAVSSTDCMWHEAYTVDTRHVSASGPRLRDQMSRCPLLPEILDAEERLAWEDKLMSAAPTLSLGNGGGDDDVIYIMTKRHSEHPW
jgi:hypothetical protein